MVYISENRPLGYESVYLPLSEVADTPFYLKRDEMHAHFKLILWQCNALLYV